MDQKTLLKYGFYPLDNDLCIPLSEIDEYYKKSIYNSHVCTIIFNFSIKKSEFTINNLSEELGKIIAKDYSHFKGIIQHFENTLEDVGFFNNSNSVIYVIQAKNTNFYKIGVSNDPINRLKQISTASPYPLIELKNFIIPSNCVYSYESRIHEIFENKRKNGEWFELNNQDLALIDFLFEKNFNVDLDKDLESLYLYLSIKSK